MALSIIVFVLDRYRCAMLRNFSTFLMFGVRSLVFFGVTLRCDGCCFLRVLRVFKLLASFMEEHTSVCSHVFCLKCNLDIINEA